MAYPTEITSRDNERIKAAVKLSSSASARKRSGRFILEGARLCADAAECGFPIEEVFFTEKAERDHPEQVKKLTAITKAAFRITPPVAEKLSDTVSTQGIFAVCGMPDGNDNEINAEGKYLALENTQDPANLGAMARTAEALGIDGLIVSSVGCDPYSPKAQRAAMGSLLRLPVIKADNFTEYLTELKGRGMRLYAAVLYGNDTLLGDHPFGSGSIVMIGNEGNGLTAGAAALADERLKIPMKGRAESLNAATAAAIILWKMTEE